ncbi:hypothetical protein PQ465_03635 [Sphingobacterium oryzagri]|uniref:YARHG domain-containing protein n=1 Tax=Sphingobacterium oryzagri TaxID=3025669 RepID=A0ABY7WME2_9SPHI|nr:hypothetical protein [Sphingobacterium sp. KACC 22765]WDF69475.1 hypothetical protein PQ465_03635 [Sphingobacterium sp. KACC 22765]
MKNYFYLIFFYLLCTTTAYSQVLFIDQDTKIPIRALNFYDEEGELVGYSDNNGRFATLLVDHPLKFPLQVTSQHLSYKDKSIILNNLSDSQVFELVPTSTWIDTVKVDNSIPEVTVLLGYYRSLETFDSNTKYFSDGIVEFYVPNYGGTVKYKLLDFRVFCDSSVQKDFDAKMGNYFKASRLPDLNGRKLTDRIKQYELDTSQPKKIVLKKNNKEVGRVEISDDDETTRLYIDLVLPDTIKSQKLFRLEARAKSMVYLENYSSGDLEKLNPYFLTSLYEHTIGSIKRKAIFGHIPYENVSHFYVMERSGMNRKEYEKISKELESNIFKTQKKSQYSHKFWEDLERFSIPPINEALQRKLNTKIKLME